MSNVPASSYDGTLERTAEGGVIRFERHLPYSIRDVWDAITDPVRLSDWWLPFDADITVDLREGGQMVFTGRGDEPVTMSFTILRVESPMLLEHTHADPASFMRWELEPTDDGCVLRLSHFVTDPGTTIDNCYVVGLHTSRAACTVPRWSSCRMGLGRLRCSADALRRHRPCAARRRPGRDQVMTQLLRVQNFLLSTDGFGAGEGQSLERPFGHANPVDLGSWAFETASWPNRTEPGGTRGLDDYFTRDYARNIGAEIMGRNKFGPQRGPWENLDWTGWWGDNPPFHTPVFVLTHHHRPSFTLADTTFHFLEATPEEALQVAKDAADGKDVRLGGGVATVREFLEADLVDTLHVAVAPIELGRGERLWASPDDLLDRFHRDSVLSPSGVTHHLFWRR